MDNSYKVEGNIIDVINSRIFKGEIIISNGIIKDIIEKDVESNCFISPGLVDSHVHIESSMLVPVEFSKLAVRHGVTSVVSDPHEIANVLGVKGVEFMLDNASKTPLKFYFGVPSCVPANPKESSGSVIDNKMVQALLSKDEIFYLSEMMNFPGVIYEDQEVLEKIEFAKSNGKPIDGHAPMLSGNSLKKYIDSGISTDHECVNISEAREKIALGMKILIREGSAAKNFDALIDLIDETPDKIMFCTDDSHPNDLINGYINKIAEQAILKGKNVLNVFKACTLNPIKHYNLKSGLLQIGDTADLVIFENIENLNVLKTYIDGNLVFDCDTLFIKSFDFEPLNSFNAKTISISDISVKYRPGKIRVIDAIDNDLITGVSTAQFDNNSEFLMSDIDQDLLKIIVIDRYTSDKKIFVGFIRNFSLKHGAIATSISHDNHNIVAVGVNDFDIVQAINLIITSKGGVTFYSSGNFEILPLPVGGIMSTLSGEDVALKYLSIDKLIKEAGCKLSSPVMTLSFMALSVIPNLKITPLGLFDVIRFDFVPLFID